MSSVLPKKLVHFQGTVSRTYFPYVLSGINFSFLKVN